MSTTEEIAGDAQDHALVDHLISYVAPKAPGVGELLDVMREEFRAVGHHLVERAPRTPDRTVALRKIHEACMASIAAVVLNQEPLERR
jgi:hypothetical protein